MILGSSSFKRPTKSNFPVASHSEVLLAHHTTLTKKRGAGTCDQPEPRNHVFLCGCLLYFHLLREGN